MYFSRSLHDERAMLVEELEEVAFARQQFSKQHRVSLGRGGVAANRSAQRERFRKARPV
jgi:hypothetical protein